MRVLLLQQPSSGSPYDHWLAEADPTVQIRLLTGKQTARDPDGLAPGAELVLVDEYFSDEATAELLRQCAEWKPDVVFCNAEDDVLRVAEARTLFGIAGQQSAVALQFRDKVRMKELLVGLPFEAVPFAPVRCVGDVLDALARFGPLIVKPRQSSASRGIREVSSPADVLRAAEQDPAFLRELAEGGLMAEQRIDGEVFHVDVLVDGPRALLVSPSRYGAPPHLFRTRNVTSVMLDPDDPDHLALDAFTRAFVRGLPEGHGVNILHLEAYRTPEGRFYAGEAACRLGGGLIKDSLSRAFGVDITRQACLLAAGLPGPAAELPRTRRTGFVLFTADAPADWVRDQADPPDWLLKSFAKDRDGQARTSVDVQGACLVQGDDQAQVSARLAALQESA